MPGEVVAVHRSAEHRFSKVAVPAIELLEGLGVQGDAHCGATVKHRSHVARGADRPNLRQVHLMHAELFDDLARAGFAVGAGDLGENITTRGVDLLALPAGARLHVRDAVLTVTGLRNPCWQIDRFRPGLLKRLVRRDHQGRVERLAGVMGVVSRGGQVGGGDPVAVELPPGPHRRLDRV